MISHEESQANVVREVNLDEGGRWDDVEGFGECKNEKD